jgi:adenylate cyclase
MREGAGGGLIYMKQFLQKLNKIRNKLLALLLVAALLPMLFLGFWAAKSVKDTRVENVKELESQLISQLNDRFKKFIDDKIATYRINIADPNVNAIGPDQQKYMLNGLLLNDSTLEEASFINPAGMEENTISRDAMGGAVAGDRDFTDDTAFQQAMQKKDYVSEVNFTEGTPWVIIASPVVNQKGTIIEVLQTRANLKGLSELMAASVLGGQGYSYVTDQKGAVIAVSDRLDKKTVGNTISNPLLGKTEDQNIKFDSGDKAILSGDKTFLSGKNIPGLGWVVFAEWPEKDALTNVNSVVNIIWIFTIILIVLVTILSIYAARALLKPLNQLKDGADEISQGKFDSKIEITTHDEFKDLGDAFNNMAGQLNKFHEEQKQKQKNLESAFGQYVGDQMIDNILKGEKVKLGGERKYITVLFSDIKNFTTISESLEPEVLVKHLNKYLTAMTDIIIKHGGVIDKYIGDAILAFWGAPLPMEDHAYKACLAAEEMIDKLKEIQKEWAEQGLPEIDIRIGVNTGGALVGNVGSEQRLSYTVIGDVVNLASRLEGLNKQYRTRIMISQKTYIEVRSQVTSRELDTVEVKGKTEGVKVYELIGVKNETSGAVKEHLIKKYEEALNLYRIRKWDSAIDIFADILKIFPDDGPALVLMARSQEYDRQPPGIEWSGVYHATEK